MIPPCPLCKSLDTETMRERDTATGNTSVLHFCNACGICGPPSAWMMHSPVLASPGNSFPGEAKGNAKGTAPGAIPVRLFLRLLAQACGSFDNVEIDHSFIGPYEDACDWAVTNGFAVETPTGCKLNQYPFKGE